MEVRSRKSENNVRHLISDIRHPRSDIRRPISDLREEAAVEGGVGNWGEVVTRYPYRKVRMDHLLSKERRRREGKKRKKRISEAGTPTSDI